MEEAKIQTDLTDSNETGALYQQGRFPSVITTDDLVFELGKEAVDRINKEKLLNNLLKKSKAAEEQAIKSQKNEAAILKKFEPLEASNKLYEADNRKLSDELAKVRQELDTLIKQKALDKKAVEDFEKSIKKLTTENTKLKSKTKPKIKG